LEDCLPKEPDQASQYCRSAITISIMSFENVVAYLNDTIKSRTVGTKSRTVLPFMKKKERHWLTLTPGTPLLLALLCQASNFLATSAVIRRKNIAVLYTPTKHATIYCPTSQGGTPTQRTKQIILSHAASQSFGLLPTRPARPSCPPPP